MSDVVISAQGLGKRYLIGHKIDHATTFRDRIVEGVTSVRRNFGRTLRGEQLLAGGEVEEFWALRDVDFEIHRGDTVGIIGRNGAGKSTLLKILSRITEPTTGRVEIRGRVASLLEVGTGFHPELTGRENIFLNGAILGMTRAEIRSRFDEIVDFASVEKFIDTPVKRYSSGMYVRLAFAVAAHLEPEILIVDEVLAVGDAEFQKKCLGKLGDVAGQGRTVIFVSHSMPAVNHLCATGYLLEHGRVASAGAISKVIDHYVHSTIGSSASVTWDPEEAPGTDGVKLVKLAVSQNERTGAFRSSKAITVTMDVIVEKLMADLNFGFAIAHANGGALWWSHHSDQESDLWPEIRLGKNRLECTLPAGWLNSGTYTIAPKISIHQRSWIVDAPPLLSFEVVLDHGVSPYWTALSDGRREGQLAPILHWISR